MHTDLIESQPEIEFEENLSVTKFIDQLGNDGHGKGELNSHQI